MVNLWSGYAVVLFNMDVVDQAGSSGCYMDTTKIHGGNHEADAVDEYAHVEYLMLA